MPLSDSQKKQHEHMQEILDKVYLLYLERDGINGMGIAFKEVSGEMTDILSFRFYVDKKKNVPLAETLPTAIEGIPTDVIEFSPVRALPSAPSKTDACDVDEHPDDLANLDSDDQKNKQDPLLGGISIGPSRSLDGADTAGTLGLMVVDNKTGEPAMLSNYHVMCLNDGKFKKGDTICQPSRMDRITGWCSNCAELERWYLGDYSNRGGVDGAIAKLTHRKADIDKVLLTPRGISQQLNGVSVAAIDDPVYKCGRTTGLTESSVEDVSGVFRSDYGPPYGDIILSKLVVAKNVSPNKFTEAGDSGSVYVNKDSNTVVALHVAGGQTRSLGSPIAAVLGALDVNIP